ncbi:transcription initiation factor TFIID subunit 12, partial [Tremellales sp. Uapishka_1]
MSRPPAARTGAGAGKADISTILDNLSNLLAMEAKGELKPLQIQQLRTLMNTQLRTVVSHSIIRNRPNPLRSLPDSLNPSKAWNAAPPLITPAAFEANILAAEKSLQYTNPLTRPNAMPPKASQPAMPANPPPAQNPAPVRPPAQASGSGTSTPTTNPTAPMVPFTSAQIKAFLALNEESRKNYLAVNPGIKQRFDYTIKYLQQTNNKSQSSSTSSINSDGTPTRPPPSNNPQFPNAQASNYASPSTPNEGTPEQKPLAQFMTPANQMTSNQPANPTYARSTSPPRPPQRPYVPPVPAETEEHRQKRRCVEIVNELHPGMEMEYNTQHLLYEIMDEWADELVRAACRLAKHRHSDRVEVKDVALHLKLEHDMTVPGFNAIVPQRVHLAPEEERKKGKMIAPAKARLGVAKTGKEEAE